jgi:transcriptional regulator with XRE-family HTH domain
MSLNNKSSDGVLGARIRAFREMNGLTQKALGSKLNKGESTVRMWELGRSEPDVETLKLLAEEFKISVDTLVGYGEELIASTLTAKERSVILFYRRDTEIRSAIDQLIESADEDVPLYTAADSGGATADAIIYVKKAEWDRIKNAPETDDTLL